MSKATIVKEEVNCIPNIIPNFTSNELSIIRLGEDPSLFDHFILKTMKS